MADIALRTYVEQIDALIDRKQIDEAIAHCRHILNYYPKHLATYQALGKALLEKKRHGEAADIFQRVLSAVPDDFVSHVGMCIIREDETNLDAALWHMERAFEVNPANPAIQEELRRLYGRRDGVTPARVRLTRGALARMYSRGNLHVQAEAELKAALRDDPERWDLSIVLAQVYLQSNRPAEAADICTAILKKLPYSQEANRILAEILQAQGRKADAVPYRQHLEATDPYMAYSNGEGPAVVRPDVVKVPRLDYTSEMAESDAAAPEWMASVGASYDEPARTTAPAAAPDWLPGASMGSSPFAADLPVASEMPDWLQEQAPAGFGTAAAPAAAQQKEAPEWLRAAATAPLVAPEWMQPVESTATAPAQEVPDWMQAAAAPATPAAEEEVPDWMKAAAPAAPAVEEEVPDWMKAAAPAAEEEVPDWMKAAAPAAEEEVPDWMKAAAPAAEEEVPDWMKTAAPAESAAEAEIPAWMTAAAPAESTAPALVEPVAEKPDWLKQMEAEADAYDASIGQPPPTTPQPKLSVELPDFLQPASPEAIVRAEQPTRLADELEQEAQLPDVAAPAGEVPDWLQAMAPPEVAAAPVAGGAESEDTLRWLEGLGLPSGQKPAEQPVTPAEGQTVETPEWLHSPAEKEAEAVLPSEALPAWAQPEAPGSSDTVVTWLSGKKVPEWLREPGQEATLPPAEWLRAPVEEEAPPPVETPPVAAAAAQPEPAAMSEDDALRWLEGLAAQQGANPEELITKPEDRLTQPPAWVAAEVAAVETITPEAVPAAAEELPEWLTQPEAPTPPAPAVAEAQPTLAAPADLAAMSEDDALRWLEGLAAQQGANPEELITKPEDRLTQPPAWVAAEAAAAPSTAQPAPVPPEEQAAPAPTVAETQPAPAAPSDLAAMSEEDALRWLEGLAAQQGANPEELITKPEDRLTQPPAWVAAEAAAAKPEVPEAAPTEAVAIPAAMEELPGWLKQPEEQAAPAPLVAETQPAPAASADLAAMSEEDALRWLEGLAAQQGANPEELITKPEDRLTQPPAWVAAEQAAAEAEAPEAAPAEAVAVPAAMEDLPEWLKAPAEEALPVVSPAAPEPAQMQTAPAMSKEDEMRWLQGLAAQSDAQMEEVAAPPAAPEPAVALPAEELPAWLKQPEEEKLPVLPVVSQPVEPRAPLPEKPVVPPVTQPSEPSPMARLAEKLAAAKQAKESEIEARFAAKRAEQEAARRAVEQRLGRKGKTVEEAPEVPKVVTPPTVPPEAAAKPAAPQAPVEPVSRPAAVAPVPPKIKTLPARPRRGKAAKSPYAGEAPENVLATGRQFILEQNYGSAAEALAYLVNSGQQLEDVVAELEIFTTEHPEAAPLLQVLGDAYMKTNRLQKALVTYRQALGQI